MCVCVSGTETIGIQAFYDFVLAYTFASIIKIIIIWVSQQKVATLKRASQSTKVLMLDGSREKQRTCVPITTRPKHNSTTKTNIKHTKQAQKTYYFSLLSEMCQKLKFWSTLGTNLDEIVF